MSRLQVGGLALIIKGRIDDRNVGKAVKLIEFVENYCGIGPAWQVMCEDGLDMNGYIAKYAFTERHRLIPLGDKQTQDELAKEKEIENA